MNPGEPLSTRAPRMKIYTEMVRELDSGGARYSQDLSEVDFSDLEDVKVRVNDPAGDVLVHLGSSDYLRRYKIYVTHAQGWRQQFQKLESVDLRYDNQIIVNPDMEGPAKPVPLSPTAAKDCGCGGSEAGGAYHARCRMIGRAKARVRIDARKNSNRQGEALARRRRRRVGPESGRRLTKPAKPAASAKKVAQAAKPKSSGQRSRQLKVEVRNQARRVAKSQNSPSPSQAKLSIQRRDFVGRALIQGTHKDGESAGKHSDGD